MARLRGSARTYLRGLAHHLRPVVQLGKNGVNERLLAEVKQALETHELIKLKFVNFKEEKKALAKEIEAQTQSEMVGLIGHIAIFYREQHDPEQRKIHIPENRR
jgi:RNA-binding protein